MSNCTVVQMRDKVIIGSDTASSIKFKGVRYRVSNNTPKIHQFEDAILFCSGKMNICDSIVDELKKHNIVDPYEVKDVAMKHFGKSIEKGEFSVEIVMAKVFKKKSIIYHISSYNGFVVKESHCENDDIHLYAAGVKTEESIFEITNGISNGLCLTDAYHAMYSKIYDESVGGYAQIYLLEENNVNIISNKKIEEKDILSLKKITEEQELVIAERLIGKVIAGQELIITNSNGTFTLDSSGATFDVNSFRVLSGNGKNAADQWTSVYKFFEQYADDGLLTSIEKRSTLEKWEGIVRDYNTELDQIRLYWTKPENNPIEVTNYTARYTELYEYLFVQLQSEKPLLRVDNLDTTSRIDRVLFKKKFNDYFEAFNKVETLILIEAKKRQDDADKELEDVKKNALYDVKINTTNGTVLRNGFGSTTLKAVVYLGATDVTDEINASRFRWTRISNDKPGDESWNKTHGISVKEIVVTGDDVRINATFQCDVFTES